MRSENIEATRRSPCPVACSLDMLGDRWTLLVVRDLILGRERFKELSASPERIPTNLLSDRLARLLEAGIVEQVPASDGTKRQAYRLTKKGQTLRPILEALRDWGLKWEKGTRAALEKPARIRQLAGDLPSKSKGKNKEVHPVDNRSAASPGPTAAGPIRRR